MKEITVDGKKYVLKADVGKEYVLKTDVEKKYVLKTKTKHKNSFEIITPKIPMNKETTVGLGSIQLDGKSIATKTSMNYLKQAVKILEMLDNESVSIVWREDNPIILGEVDKEKGVATGVIIAPIVDENE